MVKLYFTGIKHSGKTTQARLVATALSIAYSDSDDLILSRIEEESIREFYKAHGKAEFMDQEYKAVRDYEEKNPSFILSLGGGAADNDRLMAFMKESGKIIYLKRNESDMLPVILKHGIPAFLDPEDLEGSFHKVFEERDRKYSDMADLIIDLGAYGDKEETSRLVISKLKENGYV